MVTKILQQEMYYGAIAQHRREYVMPCSKVSRAIPKEEQIIIEGRHDPAIIRRMSIVITCMTAFTLMDLLLVKEGEGYFQD